MLLTGVNSSVGIDPLSLFWKSIKYLYPWNSSVKLIFNWVAKFSPWIISYPDSIIYSFLLLPNRKGHWGKWWETTLRCWLKDHNHIGQTNRLKHLTHKYTELITVKGIQKFLCFINLLDLCRAKDLERHFAEPNSTLSGRQLFGASDII